MLILAFILLSLALGVIEVGLIAQIFLNLGFAYLFARKRNCEFRGVDALKILWATGTVLVIAVTITFMSMLLLGPFIGLINAVLNIGYILFRAPKIFPEGGRPEDHTALDDIKDLIDERQGAMDWLDRA